MEVLEVIRNRRSIRSYRNRDVEDDKLERILEAARLSPSARNMQDRKFIVVRDPETRRKLMEAAKNQSFVGSAPVVIAACGTSADYIMSCGQPASTVDVSIAVDHMTLQAVEEELGTCWVCAFDENAVKKTLAIPDEVRVVTLLTLGYPAEDPEPRPRENLSEMVRKEKYL